MSALPSKIISKTVCDEHRVKIFKRLRVMERLDTKELRMMPPVVTTKGQPKEDRSGRICIFNENCVIVDDRFPPSDPRHVVAKTHRHLTAEKQPGFSRKYDPKSITDPSGAFRYIELPNPGSPCELCHEGKDRISPWDRFTDSKYPDPRVRPWHRCYHKIRTSVRVLVAQIRDEAAR